MASYRVPPYEVYSHEATLKEVLLFNSKSNKEETFNVYFYQGPGMVRDFYLRFKSSRHDFKIRLNKFKFVLKEGGNIKSNFVIHRKYFSLLEDFIKGNLHGEGVEAYENIYK